jgi:hypothetical protein
LSLMKEFSFVEIGVRFFKIAQATLSTRGFPHTPRVCGY